MPTPLTSIKTQVDFSLQKLSPERLGGVLKVRIVIFRLLPARSILHESTQLTGTSTDPASGPGNHKEDSRILGWEETFPSLTLCREFLHGMPAELLLGNLRASGTHNPTVPRQTF